MDPITAGVIAVLALGGFSAFVAIAGGAVSILTLRKMYKKFMKPSNSATEEKTKVEINNEHKVKKNKDGSVEETKIQHIVIEDFNGDNKSEMVKQAAHFIETGRPNEVANKMATAGGNALNALASSGAAGLIGAAPQPDTISKIVEIGGNVIEGVANQISHPNDNSKEDIKEPVVQQSNNNKMDLGDEVTGRIYEDLLSDIDITYLNFEELEIETSNHVENSKNLNTSKDELIIEVIGTGSEQEIAEIV